MNSIKLLFMLFCLITFISCKKDTSTSPQANEQYAQLTLQIMDSKLAKSSNKSAETINFGDIISTKTLLYLLVNQGNASAFDIQLNANKLIIEPNYFDILPGSSNSSTFLPIIQFTLPHVLSPNNVGSLWDFEVGNITDTLSMSYKYVNQQGDTVSFTDTYQVSGLKKGILINYYVKDKNALEVTAGHNWITRNGAVGTVDLLSFYGWTAGYFPYYIPEQSYFKNEGNVSIDVEFFTWSETSIFKTTLSPGDSLNLNGLFPQRYAVFGPTHYIFSICGHTRISGIAGIHGG